LLLQKRPLMESSFDWSDTHRASALNDRTWPFLAVQVMKSTHGCPTAACDPNRPFALGMRTSALREPLCCTSWLTLDSQLPKLQPYSTKDCSTATRAIVPLA
jgi:hypothetical protein